MKPETLLLEWVILKILPVFGKESNAEGTFAPAFHYLIFVANSVCNTQNPRDFVF